MQDFDAAQLNLENDLGKLDHEVRQKASNEKVEEIEDHMETLATKLDIDRVFNKLEAYTTLEKFNKMKIQQELENENLQAKIKTLVQNSQLEIEIDRMKDHVAEVNRFNASKREAARDKKELLEKIETLQKSFSLLQEDQELSKARLETLEQDILDKA